MQKLSSGDALVDLVAATESAAIAASAEGGSGDKVGGRAYLVRPGVGLPGPLVRVIAAPSKEAAIFRWPGCNLPGWI